MGTPCYLGLGGNLGHPLSLFDKVVAHFAALPGASEVQESPRYESEPVDSTGPNYVNSVLALNWAGTAIALLEACMGIEQQLGRVRTERNAPRVIDVDLLLFGQNHIELPDLTVPHPRMHLRRFVLQPLIDLNPNISIPGAGLASQCLLGTLDQSVQRIRADFQN